MNRISTFAQRLKEYRISSGYTLSDMERITHVPAQTLNRYELGQRTPKIDTAIAIAESINADALWLQGYNVPITTQASSGNSCRVNVLGKIAAGIPLDAIENIEDQEEIEPQVALKGEYFGLIIKGQSMEPRIYENDVVIVRRQPDVESGDIAVVLVNGDNATVKKVIKHENGITLVALNTSVYDPTFYSNEQIETLPIAILGKVVEVRGKLE